MLTTSALHTDRERLIATFTRLVQVDSPSRGEGAMARLVFGELQELGWSVVDDASGPDGGNVIATLPGDEGIAPLLFTSHFDVVMPCLGVQPRLDNGVFVSTNNTVLGADAKAGVAALLEMARILVGDAGRRPPVEMVFTWGEEIGHMGAKALDIRRLRARRAYVMDALTPVGTIVTAAPAYYAYSIHMLGRAAHAGVEPERGVSAIAAMAQAISRLPWGRLDESTTANIGTIRGGSARNAVAAEAWLEGEFRSHDPSRAADVERGIREAFQSAADTAGAQVELDIRRFYPEYALSASDDVVTLASRAFAAIEGGGTSSLLRSGGGSDANELNPRGITTCVLGIGAEGCHTINESLSVSQLELLTRWGLEIVSQATLNT